MYSPTSNINSMFTHHMWCLLLTFLRSPATVPLTDNLPPSRTRAWRRQEPLESVGLSAGARRDGRDRPGGRGRPGVAARVPPPLARERSWRRRRRHERAAPAAVHFAKGAQAPLVSLPSHLESERSDRCRPVLED